MNLSHTEFDAWEQALPAFDGTLEADSPRLAADVAVGERTLAALGPKPGRDAGQAELALRVHRRCRRARKAFLRRHAGALFARLASTDGSHQPLSELALRASELCPGLVPTRRQLAQEAEYTQADKEGREIDQGLLFGALLAVPEVGCEIVRRMLRPSAKALALLARFRQEGELTIGALHLERRGHVAYLTFNNRDCLNAEDNALIDSMETAVDLALLDDSVHVGVLRGGRMDHPRYRGRRVFSAGINLKHLHRGQLSYTDFLLRREFGYINKMLCGLAPREEGEAGREIPWIAAVDSFAIGGGAQIVLACDRVIAAADSYFSLPAAQEGIVPGAANLRLARRTNGSLARQIILYGRRVQAHEEDARLLFDEVVAPEAMDEAIAACAAALDSPAVIPNRRMLKLAEEPLEAFRAYMARFAVEQAERLYSEDVLNKVRPSA
jgi:thioesterase DpgC